MYAMIKICTYSHSHNVSF